MKRETTKRKNLGKTELSISSMVDVVFLLLIYFIVVQKPIIDETQLKGSLPGTPKRQIETKIRPDFVKIDVERSDLDNGHFYYRMNGRVWEDVKLFKILKNMGEINPDKTIIINCGPNARHEKLITLLDACSEAMLENLNIVNNEEIKFRPEIKI
jgi:biopolymer transport protein ExbD